MYKDFDDIVNEYLEASKKVGGNLPEQLMLIAEIRNLKHSIDNLGDRL